VNPRLALALAVLAAGALIAVVAALPRPQAERPAPAAESRFEGAVMPANVPAPDFELRDQDGEPVSMRSLRGRPAIVTFLYTHCDDSCPPQAQQIKGALDLLGADVPALAIAVDPANDTEASAREFLNRARISGRMRFVLGSRSELEPVWRGFAIRPQSRRAEHQARIVLVDARGRQRVGFPLDQATPERIAHDLRALLREA
jgi:protein SCO1